MTDRAADDLVGTLEAAQILDRTKGTVKYHVATKRLVPRMKMPGASGALLFDRTDVEALRDELKALRDEQAS
jgi:hypothetical protein